MTEFMKFIFHIRRTNASGTMSIASQGTVLAQARTRSFDVCAHENYVAPRKDLALLLIFLADVATLSKTAITRLTQSFLRQGARIHAFTPNGP